MPETVRIPLKTHALRYLETELQGSNGNIYLSEQDKLAQYLLGYVEKRDFPSQNQGVELHFHGRNRHRDLRTSAAGISAQNVDRINALLEHLMFKELFSILDYIDRAPTQSERYGKKKPMILEFCEKYDPENEELNYDMVNERYKRWRKKKRAKMANSVLK